MNVLKIIVSALLLFGCKSSTSSLEPKSFNSKTSKLFFDANIRGKYDNLISHFESVNGLEETETGWTVYPPLSALGQAENSITQEAFEFHRYLDVSSGLKDGRLVIRKIGEIQDALAVLEINLEFKTNNDADVFYQEIVNDFNVLQLDKEESTLENVQSTVYHDNDTSSVLVISVFSDKEDGLYSVTLRLVP